MLEHLSIKNIVLIEQLEFDFHQGLSVFTGETGAGKSIILDAIGLIMGDRAELRLIRHGQESASVTATFQIQAHPHLLEQLKELDIDCTLHEPLIIRRVIKKDGRSSAYVNDQPVSLNILKTIAESLVEIVGQFSTQSLFSVKNHILYLDDFLKDPALILKVKTAFLTYKKTQKLYEEQQEKGEKLKQEQDYILFVQNELSELNPQEGEEESLSEQRKIMADQQKITQITDQLNEQLFSGSESCLSLLHQQMRQLERQPDHIKHYFSNIMTQLDKVSIEFVEAQSQFDESSRNQDTDQSLNLEEIEQRLYRLRECARKYHVDVTSLVTLKTEFEQKAQLLTQSDYEIDSIRQDYEKAEQAYKLIAQEISTKRQKAAIDLTKRVQDELASLKLPTAQFHVTCEPLTIEQATERGLDRIQFRMSTQPGQTADEIQKIASGGELSRIMLALQVVLYAESASRLLIFDEIDSGIGGAVADAVGERLYQLSRQHQVFLVTHSPQVACRAQMHFKVEKTPVQDQDLLHTNVISLEEDERIEELARMLSGAKITQEARLAAQSLIRLGR